MSTLVLYKAFVSIVDNGSLAAAAKDLMVSPSSVSKKLAKLEEDLSVQLIDRTTNTLSVTEAGTAFYLRIKDAIARVEEAEQLVKDQTATPAGMITIAIPQTLAQTQVIQIVSDFAKQYPEIKINIVTSDSVENLVERKIDFAFRVGALDDSQLSAVSLTKLEMALCASPAFVKAHGKLTFRQLLLSGLLIIPNFVTVSSMNKLMKFGELGSSAFRKKSHSASDTITMNSMAVAGMGVATTFVCSVEHDIKAGRLERLPVSKKIPPAKLSLVFYRRENLPTPMRLFKAFIKEHKHQLL